MFSIKSGQGIEVHEGVGKRKYLRDEWTYMTVDGKLSTQWERTIVVTGTGVEILTLRDEER